MIKQLKLFSAHILIFIISISALIFLHSNPENEIFEIIGITLHVLLVISLYIASGYFATKKGEKFQLKNYWIIAIIGICIWLAAFINSPTDINWKKGNGGMLWLLYRIYIVPTELPFCFSDYLPIDKFNIVSKHIGLISFSIIPSVMQAFGGYLKHKKR